MEKIYPRQAAFPERLLQCIWHDQRFSPASLRSVHGKPIKVHQPGEWNCSAGPDFLHAMLQFGEAPPQVGDVEIHVCPTGWFQHRHHLDDLYRRVILHLAFQDDGQVPIYHISNHSRPITQAALQPALDAPITDLAQSIDLWEYPHGHPKTTEPCRDILNGFPAP